MMRSSRCLPVVASLALLCFWAGSASALPITYAFAGRVSEFSYSGATLALQPGDLITGSFVYDAQYAGEYLGGPWPRENAVLDWRLDVNGGSYHITQLSPFIQIPMVSGNEFSFLDEQPGNDGDAPFFDQNLFRFSFGSTVGGALPVEAFLDGTFSFAGGTFAGGNSGALLSGTIDELRVLVFEPPAVILMVIGFAVLWMFRMRHRPANQRRDS